MNLGTIIGLVLGIGLLGYAALLAAGDMGLGKLWDTVSMLVVLGGAISATAIAFKFDEVLSILKSFSRIFSDDPFTLKDIVMDAINLAGEARKGPQDLAKALEGVPETMPFRVKMLGQGAQFIADGMKKDDIIKILETQEEYRAIRYGQRVNVMKTMGVYTPAFGMIGTLIGLVFMLAGMAVPPPPGVDPAAALGASMAVALITTLYGALFANFFFLPFADKLNGINQAQKVESELCIAAVSLLADKAHPLTVRDNLNAFLDRPDRILDEE